MTRQSGQATVELALVLPFLVTVALLLVQIGLVLSDQLAVMQAAREAARAASVDPDPARARAAAAAVMPGASVRIGPRPPAGERLTVAVSYRSRTEVPLVGPLLPDPQLQARAVMRVEQ